MNFGLQRLSRSDELVLVELCVANGLDAARLGCHMTRQRDSGRGRHSNGGVFNISYNLMLCEYCGNLMPAVVCPARVAELREQVR